MKEDTYQLIPEKLKEIVRDDHNHKTELRRNKKSSRTITSKENERVIKHKQRKIQAQRLPH